MKKKIILSLAVLGLLVAAGAWYCFMEQTTFDQAFQGYSYGPPASAAASFTVVREGTFPGFSDTPVTAEEGRPYRDLMTALRGQKYIPLPALSGAPDGGTAIYYLSGCSPGCMAYWDGFLLWLPATDSEQWRPFLPLPPHSLGEELNTIHNLSLK